MSLLQGEVGSHPIYLRFIREEIKLSTYMHRGAVVLHEIGERMQNKLIVNFICGSHSLLYHALTLSWLACSD